MVRTLALPQPITKRRVVEVMVAGPIGRWFRKRQWAAITIPLPFFVFILYWAKDKKEEPNSYIRYHEFIHVKQSAELSFYLIRYFLESWKFGYDKNRFEREAYMLTRSVMDRRDLPDWAKVRDK